jgi:hypothetical protein
MANNKNNTRKRSKKTYRKKYRKNYRKNATKRMMMGGSGTGTNMFSSLVSGITGSFNIFGSRAKQKTEATIAATRADVAGKIADAKTQIDATKTAAVDRAKCIAACTTSTSSTSTSRI